MSEDSTGFVGLGAMGAHMVARLIDAGHDVAVFDTRAEAMAPHVARGARACPSAGAVGDAAATVLVSLPTPDVVRAVAGELGDALEGVVGERGGVALVEAFVLAPVAQHPLLERDAIRPAHAARVAVLHHEPVAVLRGADDADRVGEQFVIVVGALDEEVAALEPLEGDGAGDDGIDEWVGRLGGPRTDQRVEGLQGGIAVAHVA